MADASLVSMLVVTLLPLDAATVKDNGSHILIKNAMEPDTLPLVVGLKIEIKWLMPCLDTHCFLGGFFLQSLKG